MFNFSYNPFSFYKLKEVEKHGNTIFYRAYPKVLWECKNFGQKDEKWVRNVGLSYPIRKYDLEKYEILEFKKAMKSQELKNETSSKLFNKVNKKLNNFSSVDFKKEQAQGILQGEFGITDHNSKNPILATFGAGPCIILALHDKKNNISSLAHIDATTNLRSINKMMINMDINNTVAHLYGGDFSSIKQCKDIISFLKKKNIKIENCALEKFSNGCASLAIDSRNGKIYTPVSHNQMTLPDDMDLKMQLLGLTASFGPKDLKMSYNGIKNNKKSKKLSSWLNQSIN